MQNRNRRFTIGLVLLIGSSCLALVCLGVIGLSQFALHSFLNDPNGLAEASKLITQYKLPTGYEELGSVSLGNPTVMLSPPDGSNRPKIRIWLVSKSMENTPILSDDTLLYASRKMRDDGYIPDAETHKTTRVFIRGEQVPMLVVEEYKDKQPLYRYVYCHFPAANDRVGALEAWGPVSGWDQGLVDSFIASLQ